VAEPAPTEHELPRPATVGNRPGPTTRARLLAGDGPGDPAWNLALDEAIARSAGPHPTVRLWRNDRAVIVGRFQLAAAEVDLGLARAARIPVLRRFTGGGAVYHEPGNLNVSLVLARREPPLRERPDLVGLPAVYALLLAPLATAVERLGLAVERTERDLLVEGRKVSGVAAWLGRDQVLVHGTLLVSADLELLQRILDGPGAPGDPRWERTRSRRMPVTSLARALGRTPEPSAVTGAVAEAFAVAYRLELEPTRPSSDELTRATELLAARYRQPTWHAD